MNIYRCWRNSERFSVDKSMLIVANGESEAASIAAEIYANAGAIETRESIEFVIIVALADHNGMPKQPCFPIQVKMRKGWIVDSAKEVEYETAD